LIVFMFYRFISVSIVFHFISIKIYTQFLQGGSSLLFPFIFSSFFFDPSMDSDFWTSRLVAAKSHYSLQHNHPTSHLG
jgi:hypothetical protein